MSFWIFIMKEETIDYEQIIKEKKISLPKKTGNKDKIVKNDKIIFYLGGIGNMKFIGTATIMAKSKSTELDLSVELSDIDIWETPIPIQSIRDSLKFIPKKNWGSFFQGKIVWLSYNDYKLIPEKTKIGKTN